MSYFPQSGPGFGVLDGRARTGVLSLAEKVMGLTTLLVAAAMAGVAFGANGLNTAYSPHSLIWFIAEIALLFGTMALADKPAIGLILFTAFGASTGLLIAPLIQALALNGQSVIVFQALGATAAATAGLTLYARSTHRDFRGIGGYLTAALIGLVVVSLIGVFVHSTMLQILISAAACVLFSFFLVYDVQRIATTQDTRGNAIRLALGIYLDIFNLFLNLLVILGLTEGDNR